MSGTRRLPGGQPRKASQRNSRRAQPAIAQFRISWRPGDHVKWQGREGTFRRDVGDGEHSEIAIGERIYRVRTGEIG